MMTIEDIKEELENRLLKVNKAIEYHRGDLGSAYLYHHHMGFLEAADGMFGERQFLEGILEKITGRS